MPNNISAPLWKIIRKICMAENNAGAYVERVWQER